MYRLFSWEHSYFSGKVRAYLRFKERQGALGPGFEDVLATPELVEGLLFPRSGSTAVPQLETPEGHWVQDSSEIIDFCEQAHPEVGVVPDLETRPRQRLVSYLIELLADEWLFVPTFWERWFYSEDGREPSHRAFNEQQWGAMVAAQENGRNRRTAGAGFFEQAFGISEARSKPRGVYAALRQLGCDERTERAWQASQHHVLTLLEAHFGQHDYLLGGRPSLGDYGLLGPLYAHLYRDAVPGFALRTYFPLVCEWVERTNGEGALNARMYGQKLYGLDASGALVGRVATSDGGDWLADDEVPQTLLPVLEVFFDEMWPVLRSSTVSLADFIASGAHKRGDELPGKTFAPTPGFEGLQVGDGPLTIPFEIGGIASRRMVAPYQIWMLQRLERAMGGALSGGTPNDSVETLLSGFSQGSELSALGKRLDGCRVRRKRALLYSA